MNIAIRQETANNLQSYAQVPMVFTVRSRYRAKLVDGGLGGWTLNEEPVYPPYERDDSELDSPTRWRKHDISNWAFFAVYDGQHRVGGATIAWNSPGLHMLEARTDLAVLWDIRVRREYRRSGIGSQLFDKCAEWAKRRGCSRRKVETHDINVPACRFYAAKGCELRGIHHGMYTEYPGDVQFLWYLNLQASVVGLLVVHQILRSPRSSM